MKARSIHYHFSQRFDFPADVAYGWCTEYDSDDIARMGKRGTRRIQWIDDDTLVLTDTYLPKGGRGKRTTKRRLVRLYPERMTWTNTRLSPLGKYSQFLYEIVPDGEGASRLEFTGSEVEYLTGGARGQSSNREGRPAKTDKGPKETAAAEAAARAAELAEADAATWRMLAQSMEKDLRK